MPSEAEWYQLVEEAVDRLDSGLARNVEAVVQQLRDERLLTSWDDEDAMRQHLHVREGAR